VTGFCSFVTGFASSSLLEVSMSPLTFGKQIQENFKK